MERVSIFMVGDEAPAATLGGSTGLTAVSKIERFSRTVRSASLLRKSILDIAGGIRAAWRTATFKLCASALAPITDVGSMAYAEWRELGCCGDGSSSRFAGTKPKN